MALSERVQIRRVLTGSPLSRQHDRMLQGAGRRPVEIPWARFDRSKYPAPALALACKAQTMLATGEYEAVDLFSRMTSALAVNGAPIDLVAAATRAASDEIRHADYAFRMAALLGDTEDVRIEVRAQRAEERWGRALDLATLDLMMVDIVAVGEALACALITASRARATDPVARALFTRLGKCWWTARHSRSSVNVVRAPKRRLVASSSMPRSSARRERSRKRVGFRRPAL